MPDESVIYQVKTHWIVFCPAILFLSVAIISFFTDAAPFGALAMIWAIVLGVGSASDYVTAEFSVTNKRVFIYYGCGLLGHTQKTREIFLEKIESVRVKRWIWGRIFGYGTIEITGPSIAGIRYHTKSWDFEESVDFGTIGSRTPAWRSKTRLHHIMAPLEFEKELEERIKRVPSSSDKVTEKRPLGEGL